MPDPPATPSEVEGALLGEIADEVAERRRRGESPDLDEYVRRHPHIAQLILEGLPLLEMIGFPKTAPLAAPRSIPERLGEYQIVRLIGRGGMGAVYEAEQPGLGRKVALKVLFASVTSDDSAVERFRREARVVAQLHHTNIVPVYGFGEDGGDHYFAMQLIDGGGLDRIAREVTGDHGPGVPTLTPDTVVRIGVQIADALAHTHACGVVHRDVKPSNILLDGSGNAWLTDFGLAKMHGLGDLTRAGEIVGTLRFMAPECFRGEVDARADVYGLGMTLYELLTGRPAFGESDRGRLLWEITHAAPPRPRSVAPHLPRDLETIVLKAIAKEPAARYASARELAVDLGRFRDGQPIAARRPPAWELAWRWGRRHPLPAALAACVFVLLAALAVGATVTAVRLDDRNRQIGANLTRAERAEGDARVAGEREAEAKRAALRRAWELMLSEAALNQKSAIAARRHESLARLEEAAGLLREIPHNADDRHRLRDLVTAALMTPELTPGHSWERSSPHGEVLCFDADGKNFATTLADGRLQIVGVNDRLPKWTSPPWPGPGNRIPVAFSPDGRYVATIGGRVTSRDRQLLLWEVGGSRPILDLPGIVAAVFSPDSRLLACLRPNAAFEVYTLADPAERHRVPQSLSARWLVFSPDSEHYAYLQTAQRRVDINRSATHELVHSFALEREGAFAAAWVRDREHLAIAYSDSVNIYRTRDRQQVNKLLCPSGLAGPIAVDKSGQWLAAAGNDGVLSVWDVWGPPGPIASVPSHLRMPPTTTRFTVVGLTVSSAGGWKQFRFEPAAEYRRIHASRDFVTTTMVALGGKGRWLALAPPGPALAKSIHLWDLHDSGPVRHVPIEPAALDGLLIDPEELDLYALLTRAGTRRLVRWSIRPQGRSIAGPTEHTSPWPGAVVAHQGLALSPNSDCVVMVGRRNADGGPAGSKAFATPEWMSDERAEVVFAATPLADFRKGQWTGRRGGFSADALDAPRPVYARYQVAIAPRADWLALEYHHILSQFSPTARLAKNLGTNFPVPVAIWDLSKHPPALSDHRTSDVLPRTLSFSQHGRWLVEGTRAEYRVRTAGAWDTAFRLAVETNRTYPSPAIFSPDSRLLAVAPSRREVKLFRSDSWDQFATLPLRSDEVLEWLSFTPDGGRLVATTQSAIHIWELGRIQAKWRELGID